MKTPISLVTFSLAAFAVMVAALLFASANFAQTPVPLKIIATLYYAAPLAIFAFLYRDLRIRWVDGALFAATAIVVVLMFFGGDRFFTEFATADFMDQYVDTSFHVALINAIARYGYPSTDLHMGQFSWYHVATHYYDAGLVYLTGLDAKANYAMISFIKVAVGIVAIFASIQSLGFPSRLKAAFAYVLISLFIASTWLMVESHSMWLATLAALFSLPLIRRGWAQPDFAFAILFAGASILVLLGKVSLGVPFVFIMGLALWVRHLRQPSIYVAGAAIFVAFAVHYVLLTQSIPTQPMNERHYLHLKGAGIPLCVVFYTLAFYRNGFARAAAPAVTACFIIYVFILYALDNLSDVVYFNIGLWFSLAAAIAIDLSLSPDRSDDWMHRLVPQPLRAIVYAPLLRKAVLSIGPTWLLAFYVFDSAIPRASAGVDRMPTIVGEPHPIVQTDIENRIAVALDREDRAAALFVPRAIWLDLLKRDGTPDLRPSDYALKFVSTIDRPVIHGVPPGATHRYLFADYGADASWRDRLDGDCGPYPKVLILRSVAPIVIERADCSRLGN